jgi:hypothetical protein
MKSHLQLVPPSDPKRRRLVIVKPVAPKPPDPPDPPRSGSQHIRDLWGTHLVSSPSFPQFLMVISFLVSFGVIRLVTYGIREGWMPVGNVQSGNGLHIHHYLFGIAIALAVGYVQIAFNPVRGRSICAVLFGLAEALILDEFALLLNLKDVYWQQEGRQSIFAIAIVGSLISLLWITRAFTRAVIRDRRPKREIRQNR